VSLVSSASDELQMRVESFKLVAEPGAGRTGKLARVVYYQFNTHLRTLSPDIRTEEKLSGDMLFYLNCFFVR
jgi:hypothetical protein